MRLKKTQRTWKTQSTIDSKDSYTLRCSSLERSISFSFHWQVRCEAMCRVTGLMQPNVLEMWTKATSFVLGVKSRLNSSTSSFPCTFELRGRAKVPLFFYTQGYTESLSDIHWIFTGVSLQSSLHLISDASPLQFRSSSLCCQPLNWYASCFKTSKLPSRQCSRDTAKARCWSDVPWPRHVMNYVKSNQIHLRFRHSE